MPHDVELDQAWADRISPGRRGLLAGSGVAAGLMALGAGGPARAAPETSATASTVPRAETLAVITPAPASGQSPWGYETVGEPTPRPTSVRPGEQVLPDLPRPYTAIKSYHAHVYFDEDTYEKAALLRRWSAERFTVELGNWNLEPRGPHVTPSYYFGFLPEQLPVIVPWLQLNSLGLTILIHPNTDNPKADHLHYALWVNRAQPVNPYGMRTPVDADGHALIEQIFPNTTPSVRIEV